MPAPRTFLRDRNPGDYVEEQIFVVANKQLSATQNGKPFVKALLSDNSRQIAARMWNAPNGAFNAIPESGFLRVSGRVENYQDNLQLIIERFWIVAPDEEDLVLADLLPTTKKDVGQMFDRLATRLRAVRHDGLRRLAESFLADDALMAKLRHAPAAVSMHHAYVGGLLEHTLNAVDVADAIAPLYPNLNLDLVVVGLFLHDLAKTWELSFDAGFSYTRGGNLVGHIAKGAMWVETHATRLDPPLDAELLDVVQHIVLSHHGVPEYGAVKVPATPEAIAVHFIESMDAKLTSALQATRDDAGAAGFTDFQKAFGVRLYRPDPAFVAPTEPEVLAPPADAAVEAHAGQPTGEADPMATAGTPLFTNPLFELTKRK